MDNENLKVNEIVDECLNCDEDVLIKTNDETTVNQTEEDCCCDLEQEADKNFEEDSQTAKDEQEAFVPLETKNSDETLKEHKFESNEIENHSETDNANFENLDKMVYEGFGEKYVQQTFNDVLDDRKVGVYVKTNEDGFITEVNSDLFIENLDGWQKIDEGEGDRFVHAQSSYFDEPLIDLFGNYRYKK